LIDQPDQVLLVDRFADDLRQRIERGDYGTSGVIPSMSELADTWETKNRALVAEVIMLLRVQGYLTPTPRRRYRVVHPRIRLEGLTPNFMQHLEGLGYKGEEADIEQPSIEPMPLDIAKMFIRNDNKQPAIEQGVHVIHRMRRQGIVDLPLRIGHIWYPLEMAQPYLEAMRNDSRFDVPAALKRDRNIVIAEEDFTILSRVPDLNEMKELRLARYQPVLELRRICYTANHEQVVTLHRTVMDGTRFEYKFTKTVDHWK
jgi:DNA-binding GntR family transcriptional regulator